MPEYYVNNYDYLFKLKPKSTNKLWLIISLFLITIFIFSWKYQIYDVKTYQGIINQENEFLEIIIHPKDYEYLDQQNQIFINDQENKYTIENISNLNINDQLENYQIINLKLENFKNYSNNQIVDIKIKFNKELLIKKIWKKIIKE